MSIIGCYVLDLYCDNEQSHFVKPNTGFEGYYNIPHFEYTGSSKSECIKKAIEAGWSVDTKHYIARCPYCKGKRIHKINDNAERIMK